MKLTINDLSDRSVCMKTVNDCIRAGMHVFWEMFPNILRDEYSTGAIASILGFIHGVHQFNEERAQELAQGFLQDIFHLSQYEPTNKDGCYRSYSRIVSFRHDCYLSLAFCQYNYIEHDYLPSANLQYKQIHSTDRNIPVVVENGTSVSYESALERPFRAHFVPGMNGALIFRSGNWNNESKTYQLQPKSRNCRDWSSHT